MKRSFWSAAGPDCGWLALLALASIAAGWGIDRFRAEPLPLVYREKAARLEASLGGAGEEPAVSPASEISLAQFRARVQSGRSLIVDARPAVFFRLGHVPGAVNLPREDFAAAYARLKGRLKVFRRRSVVVYCSDEACEDSRLASAALEKLGYRNVAVFPGGWDEWTAAGLPREKEAAP